MSDRQALLLAIRAAPDDDLPRLAYADWLDEHGDAARADLIRLQCRMARADSYEPEFWALEARDRALRDEHEARWRAELPPVGQVNWGPFIRGFVEGVTADDWASFRRHAGRVRGTIHLRTLGLHVGAKFHAFKGASCLAGVERLWLSSDGRLAPRCVPALADLPEVASLKALTAYGQGVNAAGVRALAATPHLAGLEWLDLRSNMTAGAAAGPALAASPHLRRLRRLDLYNTQMGDESALALIPSPAAAGLTALRLGNNHLTDAPLLALAHSGPCGLEELSLDYNPFTLTGLHELLASPAVARLKLLSLSGNPLGDGLAEAVAQAPGLRELRALSLVGCGLGPAGARALAQSPHLRHLRQLCLDVNQVGDEGVAALAAAPWIADVRVFSLTHNAVGDAGMLALARVRPASHLHRSGLTGNPISDAAWERALRAEAAP